MHFRQIPIILIGFAGLFGVAIPRQVSAWVAVLILPLNAAINPVVYTLTAIDYSDRYIPCVLGIFREKVDAI